LKKGLFLVLHRNVL